MKKIRMCFPKEKTFADGFTEYILDCKAGNLRDGTITHYQEAIKQIYKRIPPDTPIIPLVNYSIQNGKEKEQLPRKQLLDKLKVNTLNII